MNPVPQTPANQWSGREPRKFSVSKKPLGNRTTGATGATGQSLLSPGSFHSQSHVDSARLGQLLQQEVRSGPPSPAVCFDAFATQAAWGGMGEGLRCLPRSGRCARERPLLGVRKDISRSAAGGRSGARRFRAQVTDLADPPGRPPLVWRLGGLASPRSHLPPMPCWVVPLRPGASILRVWKTRPD